MDIILNDDELDEITAEGTVRLGRFDYGSWAVEIETEETTIVVSLMSKADIDASYRVEKKT